MKADPAPFLGLAKKAGKIILGFDAVLDSIKDEKAKLVLISTDLSEKTEEDVRKKANTKKVVVSKLPFTMNEIDYILGKHSGIISVTDEGFAKKLLEIINDAKGI